MPKIALSYRRADTDAITGRIFDRLLIRYGRESVFRDIDNIPVGVDFRAHVNEVLDKSDIVLVIVGSRWLGGRGTQNRLANPVDPVRIEVETALRKGTPIIPVLVGRTGMPKIEQLPESLVDFAYRNGVRVDTGQDFDLHMDRLIRAVDGILQTASAAKEQDADGRSEGSGQQSREQMARLVEPVSRSRRRLGWAAIGTTLLIAACLTLWTVERREQEKAHEAAVAEAARQSAEAARREAEAKARQEQAATAEAARREAEAKARREQVATSVPALYRELQRVSQPEARDPTGKVTVEAATIHVLSCEGPGGNGVQIYLYEYAHRLAFRAVAPPNWGTALGGRDFSNFGDAARAGCGIPPAR